MSQAMYRSVFLLATAQALFQTAAVIVMTVGGLAGIAIASRPALATLPLGAMFLGTALAMFPASSFMARYGRRAGFLTGTGLGLLGGSLAALGIWLRMLPILALGTLLIGAYQGFAQFYRFAASEVSSGSFRPKAIGLVLGGGVVAAVLGPFLARVGGPLLEPHYLACFLIVAVLSAIATGVLMGLQVPAGACAATTTGPRRPLPSIVLQPVYLTALFGSATGYGVMILAMTATPLAMQQHHHDLGAAASVIQLHVLGMFVPSFFTGSLIARFGVLRIMLTGVMLLSAHVLTTRTGTGFNSFASALVLLGVGWNFLFIGGTTLLTSAYQDSERAPAQATHDMIIFAVGLVCSLGAGVLLHRFGWRTLNTMLIPWLLMAAISLILFGGPRLRLRTQEADLVPGIPGR